MRENLLETRGREAREIWRQQRQRPDNLAGIITNDDRHSADTFPQAAKVDSNTFFPDLIQLFFKLLWVWNVAPFGPTPPQIYGTY